MSKKFIATCFLSAHLFFFLYQTAMNAVFIDPLFYLFICSWFSQPNKPLIILMLCIADQPGTLNQLEVSWDIKTLIPPGVCKGRGGRGRRGRRMQGRACEETRPLPWQWVTSSFLSRMQIYISMFYMSLENVWETLV